MYCNLENREVKLTVTQVLRIKEGDNKILRKCDHRLCTKKTDNECLCNKLMSTKEI
jgi:hypothetical protein